MAPTSRPPTLKAKRFSPEKVSEMFRLFFQRIDESEFYRFLELKEIDRLSQKDTSKVKSLSLEEVSNRFHQYIHELNQPACHQALRNIFYVDYKTSITQCICLGLGPFAIGAADLEVGQQPKDFNAPLHQLAVLTVVLGIIGGRHSIQNVYCQDPVFTKVERAFLQSLGYTILEDPAACQKMSTGTFLFAPYLGHDVAAKALSVAFPALYIGNSPAKCLESIDCHKNNLGHTAEFQESMNIFHRFNDATFSGDPLPRFDQHRWTEGTTVCWLSSGVKNISGGRD